ncbi:hypothetical protein LCGC14_1542240 [marine sediment metagenome]|uniref:DUF4261 domain-containing protein n=1 Tax=marine sediment metagenome TaxID=412755 RepID=A0A0F9LTI2_9ZZZZ
MVMLGEDAVVSVSDIQHKLSANWPDLPAATDTDEKDDTLSFRVGSFDIILAKMPAPIPWSDLEGPCATSTLWPKAGEQVKGHEIHWIVTVSGESSPLELSTLLTQVTASVMAACPSALGVYWGNARLVVPKNIFIDFAKEVLPHGPPLHIWVDFRVGKDTEKSSSGFTSGMAALGHLEFEAQGSPEPPGELRERLLSLAGYVVENGPAIKDGDTIGEDANERIRIVYAKSAFGHRGQVMRLEYEGSSPKKPWWKLW